MKVEFIPKEGAFQVGTFRIGPGEPPKEVPKEYEDIVIPYTLTLLRVIKEKQKVEIPAKIQLAEPEKPKNKRGRPRKSK